MANLPGTVAQLVASLTAVPGPEVIKLFSCSAMFSKKKNCSLRYISRTNFMLSWVEHEKSFITRGWGPHI